MSPEIDPAALAARRVVYDMPGEVIQTAARYQAADGTWQPMDIYCHAARRAGIPAPAVVIVTGYPDAGVRRIFGRNAKDFGSTISWAELLARSGLAAIAYVNTNPVEDVHAAISYVRRHATEFEIDADRIGVWSCSGNVPNALAALMQPARSPIRCGALLYGYMLDLDGSTTVQAMSKFGFVTPAQGKTVADLPPDLPLFIARAGLDEMPRLNETLDAFVTRALAANLPLILVNHHRGPHAFDIVDASDASQFAIRQVLAFFRAQLGSADDVRF